MATVGGKKNSGFIPPIVKNIIPDAIETGSGLLLGPLMLGGSVGTDILKSPWDASKGQFMPRTKNMGRAMGRGFMEESPLVPLVDILPGVDKFERGEGWKRFEERPVSGSLDLLGTASGITGLAGRAARARALNMPKGAARDRAMMNVDYHKVFDDGQARKYTDELSVENIPDTDRFRFAKGRRVGDEVYARPTHRFIKAERNKVADLLDREIRIGGGQRAYHNQPLASDFIMDKYKGKDQFLKVPQKRSRTPWAAGIGDFLNDTRSAESGSRKAHRLIRKNISRSQHVSAASANQLSRQPITEWRRFVNKTFSHMDEPARIKLADHTAMLGLMNYRNVGMRLDDFANAPAAAADRLVRVDATIKDKLAKEAKMRPLADELSLEYDRLKDRMTPERSTLMKKVFKDRQQTAVDIARLEWERKSVNNFLNDIKKADKGQPRYWDLGTGQRYWQGIITGKHHKDADFLGSNAEFIDTLLASDEMENLRAKMHQGGRHREELAMFNYGDALSAEKAHLNKFRQAEVYTIGGAKVQKNQDRYRLQKKNGEGTWDPLFIPMRRQRDSSRTPRPSSPLAAQRSRNINDPLDVELNGQLDMNPDIFVNKHYEELHEFNRAQILEGVGNEKVAVHGKALDGMKREGLVETPDDAGRVTGDTPLVAYTEGDFLAGSTGGLSNAMSNFSKMLREDGNHIAADALIKQYGPIIAEHNKLSATRKHGKSKGSKQDLWDVDYSDRAMLIPTQTYQSLMDAHIDLANNVTNMLFKPYTRMGGIERGVQKATNLWKNSVLQWRPKWMVNNAIGMVYMLSLQEGWTKGFMSMARASGLQKWVDDVNGTAKKNGWVDADGRTIYFKDLYEERFYDVLGSTGTSSLGSPMGALSTGRGGFGEGYRRAMDGVNAFNSKYFDNPARKGRLDQIMRREIATKRAHMKDAGKNIDHLSDIQVAHNMLDDLDIRDRIAEEALGDMIDFQDLTQNERVAIAVGFSPFWSWLKGSTKAQGKSLIDKPRTLTTRAYMGDAQQDLLEDYLGTDVPSFLKASLPVGGLPGFGPKATVSFAAASPAETAATMLNIPAGFAAGKTLYGSESPMGLMGPLPAAMGGYFFNRHPFYGTSFPSDRHNVFNIAEMVQPPIMKWARGFEGPEPWMAGPMKRGSSRTAERSQLGALIGQVLPRPMEIRPRQAGQRAREEAQEFQ